MPHHRHRQSAGSRLSPARARPGGGCSSTGDGRGRDGAYHSRGLSPRRGRAALDRTAHRGLLSCLHSAHGRAQTRCATRHLQSPRLPPLARVEAGQRRTADHLGERKEVGQAIIRGGEPRSERGRPLGRRAARSDEISCTARPDHTVPCMDGARGARGIWPTIDVEVRQSVELLSIRRSSLRFRP